jgi:hypothetical protein
MRPNRGSAPCSSRNAAMNFAREVDLASIVKFRKRFRRQSPDEVARADRSHFDNWAEHEALYPEREDDAAIAVRAEAHRQVPKHVRARLAERALVIGGDSRITAAA